jgi:hypothetical protein
MRDDVGSPTTKFLQIAVEAEGLSNASRKLVREAVREPHQYLAFVV